MYNALADVMILGLSFALMYVIRRELCLFDLNKEGFVIMTKSSHYIINQKFLPFLRCVSSFSDFID